VWRRSTATHEATTSEADKPYNRLLLPLAAASAPALCSCAAAVLRRRALRDLCIPSFPSPSRPPLTSAPARASGAKESGRPNGRESEPRRPARGGAGRGRVAPGGGWGVFKRPEELHQGERKREALLCCSARDLVGFVFPFALCESCNLSIQPVLRWILSIAWIVRVVYALQHLEPSSFVFKIQILNQLFNSLCGATELA